MKKTLYCGIDLHSTNAMYVVIDGTDKVVFKKRLPNDLTKVEILSNVVYRKPSEPAARGCCFSSSQSPKPDSWGNRQCRFEA